MPFCVYFEISDPQGGVMRGKVGDVSGYNDLPEANAVARAHSAVVLSEDRSSLCTAKTTGGGGVKIVVGDELGGGTFTAWVSDKPVPWNPPTAALKMLGVEVNLVDLPAKGSPEVSAKKRKLDEVDEGGAADGGAVAAPSVGSAANNDPDLWRAQLATTDWGGVPGVAETLPPVPMFGEHSPLNQNVLKALMVTPLKNVRCVLVAKYPYPDPTYATGLALSPPVLTTFHTNVLFKALAQDPKLNFNGRRPLVADLSRWATDAGVLLLNASLQDEKAETLWKPFLTKAIGAVCTAADKASTPVGFIFLGKEAKLLKSAVTGISTSCVVECTYPAMQYAKPFVQDPPFSKIDSLLQSRGAQRIKWEVLSTEEERSGRHPVLIVMSEDGRHMTKGSTKKEGKQASWALAPLAMLLSCAVRLWGRGREVRRRCTKPSRTEGVAPRPLT